MGGYHQKQQPDDTQLIFITQHAFREQLPSSKTEERLENAPKCTPLLQNR